MKILVDVTCDWASEDNDDQRGRVKIQSETGSIIASWGCEGGKGTGAKLLENGSSLPDEVWDEILDQPSLYQGFSSYEAELHFDKSGTATIQHLHWISNDADTEPSSLAT